MQRIRDDVAKYGWHVVAIRPDDNDPIQYSFTVGLIETYNHPELVIFGLSGEMCHGIFSACLERIREGTSFEAGQVRSDVLKRHSLAVFEVQPSYYEEYLGSATGYYDSFDIAVLQLVWPDKDNRFPWEPGFDPDCEGLQRLLNSTAA